MSSFCFAPRLDYVPIGVVSVHLSAVNGFGATADHRDSDHVRVD